MSELAIKIRIAERDYPMRVDVADEERLRLAGRDPDEGLTEIAYEKGCALLLTLEDLIGRSRLDAFIKEYFSHFNFQAMDTDAMLRGRPVPRGTVLG